MNNISLSILMTCLTISANAQSSWGGRKCAVVLTYDDALDAQLDNAAPLLDSLGLKATFYVTAFSSSVQTRMNDWKKLPQRGHELGNHTLFHPCIANIVGREFVPAEYRMNEYSVRRMVDETKMTNLFLQALDGKTTRSFAYTCGDMKIGDSFFIGVLKKDFVAARAVRNEMHPISQVNLYDVDCFMVNNHTGAQMIDWVKQASATNSLLVILFHGVGGGHGLNVRLEAHRELLRYLKANEKTIWVAPMITVAEHVKKWQEKNQSSNN